ncbi:MAG: hypothetical protein ACE5K4_01150 [Candidatus Hydrothermarchaeota archaeon]
MKENKNMLKGVMVVLFTAIVVAVVLWIIPSLTPVSITQELKEDRLYSIDREGRLISIDPQTAEYTIVTGLYGQNPVHTSLAFSPDGKLFGYTKTIVGWELCVIDVSTGKVKSIGKPNPVLGLLGGLAFDRQGNFYGLGAGASALYSIDPVTGDTKLIGETGLDALYYHGLAIDFKTDELYAVIGGTVGLSDKLVHINKTTGKATVVGLLDVYYPWVGVEFSPVTGELFAVRNGNILMKVNVSTGKATYIGTMKGIDVAGLAAIWP